MLSINMPRTIRMKSESFSLNFRLVVERVLIYSLGNQNSYRTIRKAMLHQTRGSLLQQLFSSTGQSDAQESPQASKKGKEKRKENGGKSSHLLTGPWH